MPSTNIDDIDQLDETDNTTDGIIRRLGKVARVQERLNARLLAISAGLGTPPEPVRPTIQTAIEGVRTQVTESSRLLDEITVKNRGVT